MGPVAALGRTEVFPRREVFAAAVTKAGNEGA